MEKLQNPTLNFAGIKCKVVFGKYAKDALKTAIALVDNETNEEVAMATSNLPTMPLTPSEVLIKNYSENEGILEALINARVIESTGIKINTGYTHLDLCYLLIDPSEYEDSY